MTSASGDVSVLEAFFDLVKNVPKPLIFFLSAGFSSLSVSGSMTIASSLDSSCFSSLGSIFLSSFDSTFLSSFLDLENGLKIVLRLVTVGLARASSVGLISEDSATDSS